MSASSGLDIASRSSSNGKRRVDLQPASIWPKLKASKPRRNLHRVHLIPAVWGERVTEETKGLRRDEVTWRRRGRKDERGRTRDGSASGRRALELRRDEFDDALNELGAVVHDVHVAVARNNLRAQGRAK